MEDERIVRMYLDRDEDAIRCSAEKYGSRLRALATGITGDARIAEECENDTYLRAWDLIPPNEPWTYLYPFLARITRHVSIDRCRRQASLKRSAYVVELSEELEACLPSAEGPEDTLSAEELGKAIGNWLQTLSREKRVIFVRRYFYLDSVREISRRYGISESKVKSSLFRARNGLRQYLIREGHMT